MRCSLPNKKLQQYGVNFFDSYTFKQTLQKFWIACKKKTKTHAHSASHFQENVHLLYGNKHTYAQINRISNRIGILFCWWAFSCSTLLLSGFFSSKFCGSFVYIVVDHLHRFFVFLDFCVWFCCCFCNPSCFIYLHVCMYVCMYI